MWTIFRAWLISRQFIALGQLIAVRSRHSVNMEITNYFFVFNFPERRCHGSFDAFISNFLKEKFILRSTLPCNLAIIINSHLSYTWLKCHLVSVSNSLFKLWIKFLNENTSIGLSRRYTASFITLATTDLSNFYFSFDLASIHTSNSFEL